MISKGTFWGKIAQVLVKHKEYCFCVNLIISVLFFFKGRYKEIMVEILSIPGNLFTNLKKNKNGNRTARF